MATEKRLIDANELIKQLWAHNAMEPGLTAEIEHCTTVDAVEVPCKIGDRVWVIRCFRGVKHPQEGIVSEMFFTEGMELCIVVKNIARGVWGKTVFATKEEALAKMDGERRPDED